MSPSAKDVLAWWRTVVRLSTEKGEGDAVIDKALRVLAVCEEYEAKIHRVVAETESVPGDHGPVMVPASFLRAIATALKSALTKETP